ncbi:hypothetical protein HZ992_11335 [Rhizobacter sp. AJA081-3]|nr:hypothetical protein HZ992_11335 [Rhizobacter sp. AJA081-3]
MVVLTTAAALWPLQAAAQANTVVYRCPGPPVLYTDTISAAEAKEKGCRTIEGAPVTVIQGQRPRTGSPVPASSGPRPADSKVEPAQQRARDGDARRILEGELRKEEEQLEQMLKDYNKGEPERRGDERNYQKYLDRVAEMKAAIARKESDIAAIKREISKLPAS